MQPKTLTSLVQQLVETDETQHVDREQLQALHTAYRCEVAPTIDAYRKRQRRADEDSRLLTLD